MILLPWLFIGVGILPAGDLDAVFEPSLLVRTRTLPGKELTREERKLIADYYSRFGVPRPDPSLINPPSVVLVEHVYSGDRSLKGRTIRVNELGPQRLIGEVRIDWLIPPAGPAPDLYAASPRYRTAFLVDHGRPAGFPVPGRRVPYAEPRDHFGTSRRYTLARQWAQVVEEVAARKGPDRVALLRRHCLHPNPHVAAWCIYLLGDYKPEGFVAFLTDLTRHKDLSIGGQVAADELLLRLARKEWYDSPARRALFHRWAGGEIIDHYDYQRVVEYLDILLQDGNIDWPAYIAFVLAWRTQQELPWCAGHDLRTVSRAVHDQKQAATQAVLVALPGLLKTTDDSVKQLIALDWLRELADGGQFTEDSLRQLTDLQRSAEPKAAKLIAAILAKH
jgi:hypothetical protein